MTESSPLKLAFARQHPEVLATHLATRSHDELLHALNGLPADAGSAVIAHLPHPQLIRLLASQSDETVTSWLSQAALNDALTLVLHLAEVRRANVLRGLPIRHMRRTLERLVVYPQKTVGALVDPTVVRLSAGTTLQDAIAMLRADQEQPQESIWIVDGDGRYVGLLDLGRALVAPSGQFRVEELAVRLEPLRAETALAAARDVTEWLKHPELPVVDHLDHLLGALSRERLMGALASEQPIEHGIVDGLTSLTNQYFRVLGLCLGDLLGSRPR
jgi:Mg/Co/Ni transporter MgtE